MVEPLGRLEVPFRAGDAVQVGQRLGQPAELVLQHLLHVRVAQPRGAGAHPVGELGGDVQRLPDAGQLVLVDHPGHVLVDHVVRRPDVPALLQPVEEVLGERRQVAGRVAGERGDRLQLRELADQVLPRRFRPRIAGAGVREREPGQQVAGGVPADLHVRGFPPAARQRQRRPAVVQPERVQHPVRVEEQQVVQVPCLVGLEGARQQPDRRERVRRGSARGPVRRVAAARERVTRDVTWAVRPPGGGRRSGGTPPRRRLPVGQPRRLGRERGAAAEHGEQLTP